MPANIDMEKVEAFYNELSEITGIPVPLVLEIVLEMVADGRLPIERK